MYGARYLSRFRENRDQPQLRGSNLLSSSRLLREWYALSSATYGTSLLILADHKTSTVAFDYVFNCVHYFFSADNCCSPRSPLAVRSSGH